MAFDFPWFFALLFHSDYDIPDRKSQVDSKLNQFLRIGNVNDLKNGPDTDVHLLKSVERNFRLRLYYIAQFGRPQHADFKSILSIKRVAFNLPHQINQIKGELH